MTLDYSKITAQYPPRPSWYDELRALSTKLYAEGMKLTRIDIDKSCQPHLEIMTPEGRVYVHFTEFEHAKNRVFGLR